MNGKQAKALRREARSEKFKPIIRQYSNGSSQKAETGAKVQRKIYKMLKYGFKLGEIILPKATQKGKG